MCAEIVGSGAGLRVAGQQNPDPGHRMWKLSDKKTGTRPMRMKEESRQ